VSQPQRRRVLTGLIAPDAPQAWAQELPPVTAPASGSPRWSFVLWHDGEAEEELRTNTDATAAATLRAVADRIDPVTPAPAPRRRRWWVRRR
jgi:hypothetical protein